MFARSNLFEHVSDSGAAAAACEEIVGPGGLILATVPSSYPYHADPIDTGLRPAPAALAALFARSTTILAEELEDGTYADEIRTRRSTLPRELGRTLAAIALLRPKSFRARLDRWRWYRRRYRVAIALVRAGPSTLLP